MSLNLAMIEGRLGRDPETRQVGQTTVTKLAVATTEKWNDKNSGQKMERTTWHNVEAWGRQGEIIAQYFKKGDGIGVQGTINTDEYEKNSEKRYATKIKLNSFWFPVASNNSNNNQSYQNNQQPQGNNYQQNQGFNQQQNNFPNQQAVDNANNAPDDDIPF
ncbi:single-stranded DNA-binding protein [Psychrobacter sp. I-STPA6b]|uniref:single-stranded DNA-binding protein n=1 Tax=Psychrobacter sp. I-STPA6b TaxID=2585718 RepID=UPI001D0C2AB3|nr:single-stranded DNA-binding protein [Psychrobacter sp. I-STPA6b]